MALAFYGLAWLAAWLGGFRMAVPAWYFQYLSTDVLRDRLVESLFNLHAQPPLLDLVFGLALKLERATGIAHAASLLLLQTALGGVAVWSLATLLERLAIVRWARVVVIGLLVVNPVFYHFLFLFFSPIYELALLLLGALAAQRLATDRRPRHLAWCAAWLVTLAWTRSLFHFGWVLAVLAACAGLAAWDGAAMPGQRRSFAVIVAAAAVALLAWPLKNQLRFGVFSYSSWQGYNLSRGLEVPTPPALRAFTLPVPAAVEEARALARPLVPERFRGIPALAELQKSDGSPNWNHYAMIPLSRALGAAAASAIEERPSRLLSKAWRTYRDHFTRFVGQDPYTGRLRGASRGPLAVAWMRAYRILVLQVDLAALRSPRAAAAPSPGDVPAARPVHGFALIFPIALALIVWRTVRTLSRSRAAAVFPLYLLACIVWVLAITLVTDGIESNRMRFSTEPLLWVGVAWALRRAPTG